MGPGLPRAESPTSFAPSADEAAKGTICSPSPSANSVGVDALQVAREEVVLRECLTRPRRNFDTQSALRSSKKETVQARHVHNSRLLDALKSQAFAALTAFRGARACYNQQKARGVSHHAALRHLANRLVSILHGCLKIRTPYDEATVWPPAASQQTKTAS